MNVFIQLLAQAMVLSPDKHDKYRAYCLFHSFYQKKDKIIK